MKRVILASASPRRKELLASLVDGFEVVPSTVDEDLSGDGFEDAGRLALAKARDVLKDHPDALVIGSDTVVYDDERTFGKPADAAEVLEMWRSLRGRRHMVATGVAVATAEGIAQTTHASTVELHDLTDAEIQRYAASVRPLDKAGAYAIQDEDVPTVARLDGCYCSVMGLPLWPLKELLEAAGVPVRDPSATFERCRQCPTAPWNRARQ